MKENNNTQHTSAGLGSAALLAAAFAGILSNEAEAASVVETTDFGYFNGSADTVVADLSATITDLSGGDSVSGSFSLFGGDTDHTDVFLVSGPANTAISVPWSLEFDNVPVSGRFIDVIASPDTGVFPTLAFVSPGYSSGATSLSGTLDFTVPSNGLYSIMIGYTEGGSDSASYTFGTVPEPSGIALLGVGMAATLLARRRS